MESKSKKIKHNLTAYGFLSPWFIGFICFTGGPIISSFIISLTNWNLLGEPLFIGLGNYIKLFNSQDFYNSLRVTFIYTLINVTISILFSLILALLLNMNVKFKGLFQFCYFIPAVMPTVVIAFIFQLMLNKEIGIVNYLLSFLGIHNPPNWLNDTFWIWPTIGIITIFTYSTGQMMLIFNSALKEVPKELYEACDIDGANFIQKFFYVTLPSISPIILFNTVVATINSFNSSFSLLFPLTEGGPRSETEVLSLSIYKYAFKLFDMGYASALSVILFVIVAIITAIQFRITRDKVYYN